MKNRLLTIFILLALIFAIIVLVILHFINNRNKYSYNKIDDTHFIVEHENSTGKAVAPGKNTDRTTYYCKISQDRKELKIYEIVFTATPEQILKTATIENYDSEKLERLDKASLYKYINSNFNYKEEWLPHNSIKFDEIYSEFQLKEN